MATKTVKPISSAKSKNAATLEEIKAVKEVLKIKKTQTAKPSEIKIETPNNDNTEPTINTTDNIPDINDNGIVSEPVNTTEPIIQPQETAQEIKTTEPIETASNFSLDADLSEQTQEDVDKKTVIDEFNESDNISSRVEGLTSDDFTTNEGATDEEDNEEYRKQMSKIKASALVEFFDVVFMVICLVITKDFSDANQTKFTLVAPRKNAIKANVFQLLAHNKKKHNPMGTLVFLIIFSYVPLVAMAVMSRIKSKKEAQERALSEQNRAKELQLQEMQYKAMYGNNSNKGHFNPVQVTNPTEVPTEAKKRGRKPKIKSFDVNTGHEVVQMKNGSYKNKTTGQIYKGGRGRQPAWVKEYIGKIG